VHCSTALQVVLSSDEPAFGGYSNVTKESDAVLSTDEGTYDNRPNSFQVRSSCPGVWCVRTRQAFDVKGRVHPLIICILPASIMLAFSCVAPHIMTCVLARAYPQVGGMNAVCKPYMAVC